MSKSSPEIRAKMIAIASMRIGISGYAKILGGLVAGPMNTAEIAAAHGVSHLAVLMVMRHWLRHKIVHRCNWYRTAPHARMVPVWALGAGGDVSMPMYEERTRRPRPAPSGVILLTTLIQMLSENALTYTEIAEELCMHIESAHRLVAALRSAGLIHVASWHTRPIGTPSAEFAFGPGRDKPRPKTARPAAYFAGRRAKEQQMRVLQALANIQPLAA